MEVVWWGKAMHMRVEGAWRSTSSTLLEQSGAVGKIDISMDVSDKHFSVRGWRPSRFWGVIPRPAGFPRAKVVAYF